MGQAQQCWACEASQLLILSIQEVKCENCGFVQPREYGQSLDRKHPLSGSSQLANDEALLARIAPSYRVAIAARLQEQVDRIAGPLPDEVALFPGWLQLRLDFIESAVRVLRDVPAFRDMSPEERAAARYVVGAFVRELLSEANFMPIGVTRPLG